MNRTFATLAFVGTLALSSPVSAQMVHSCQTLRNNVQSTVDTCWFWHNAEQDPQRRPYQARRCEQLLQAGNQMIQWCNANIASCPTDNYGRKRITYTLGNTSVTFPLSWSINCV
jgi:hypothetical protein